MSKLEIFGLTNIGEIEPGDDIAEIISNSAADLGISINPGDVLVLATKIVSKAENRLRRISAVKPTKRAKWISKKTGKDAAWVQMVLDEKAQILAIIPFTGMLKDACAAVSQDPAIAFEVAEQNKAMLVTMTPDHRLQTADAGIDNSNSPGDVVTLLPRDPDASARQIRLRLMALIGGPVAVILSDTEMIPMGTMDFAVGSAGIAPRTPFFARKDRFGKPKFGGTDLITHELASAAALLFGQTDESIPAVIIRGLNYEISEYPDTGLTLKPEMIKEVLVATAAIYPFWQRVFLRILARIF